VLLRAPIQNETERAHFQRRLSLTFLVVFILAFGFWLITVGVHPFVGHGSISVLYRGTVSTAQLTTTFAALTGWAILRFRKWSINFLDAADVLFTLAICWGWDFMSTCDSAVRRPELIGILAVSYTLVTRSALVPSTSVRTALIGLCGFAPIIPATYAMYARDASTTELTETVMPLGPAVYAAIWSALGSTCTSVISYVVHGLRLEVSRAMKLGQYLLETKIGEGGMGVVYRASHAMLRRPTAIKLLTGTANHASERFEREVQHTARLTHPNTIQVYDYGRTPDGVFYYAMEYLEGITLDELVRDYGPQNASRVAHILQQICGALEEAHAAGLVHRDIKPANVMLTERGGMKDVVKVLDFGLVKDTDGTALSMSSSMNAVMGTPHFMAPEAILDPQNVDARTDIYALGVTAYFLLTGERVFDGANLVEICSGHLHQDPTPPSKKNPEVPESLEQVIMACLAKKPEDRPKTAEEVSDRLIACALPSWTRGNASEWWATSASKKKSESDGHRPTVKTKRRAAHVFGATVTIALRDRDSLTSA
jgi:eukaryotic-like serine/threonine-protein kinase